MAGLNTGFGPYTDAVRVFLARTCRLDKAALVRIRPDRDGRAQLWTVLPFGVLAGITVSGGPDTDITVTAAGLAAALPSGPLPSGRDTDWRAALPSGAGTVLDEISAAELRGLGAAAADTLGQARGKGVGDRRLRDALLDHVALRVTDGDMTREIRLRVVLGMLRMGFVGPDPVRIRRLPGRCGLESASGVVWERAAGLTLR